MKIIAGINCYNSEKSIARAIGSWYHLVDLIIVACGKPLKDNTWEILNRLYEINPNKMILLDELPVTELKDGFSEMKNKLIKNIKIFNNFYNINAEWIFNPDADHIYYNISKNFLHYQLHKINLGIVRSRQYFLYSNNRILDIPIYRQNDIEFCTYISFIKMNPIIEFSNRVHESLNTGIPGQELLESIRFVHVGPLRTDEEYISNFIMQKNLQGDNRGVDIIMSEEIKEGRFPKDLKDCNAFRRGYNNLVNLNIKLPEIYYMDNLNDIIKYIKNMEAING